MQKSSDYETHWILLSTLLSWIHIVVVGIAVGNDPIFDSESSL